MTVTATAKREYKLAADPIQRQGLPPVREILEFTDGHRSVFVVVANDDALDVLEAIRRAYQDGREDRAASLTVARNDVIGIIPERGPRRTMLVAHVEHHIITLADLDGA